MSICVCVNRTIDGDLRVMLDGNSYWTDWHHCIKIIMTRMYKFFQSLNVIDKIIIIFIH